jgi:hypothetical protein
MVLPGPVGPPLARPVGRSGHGGRAEPAQARPYVARRGSAALIPRHGRRSCPRGEPQTGPSPPWAVSSRLFLRARAPHPSACRRLGRTTPSVRPSFLRPLRGPGKKRGREGCAAPAPTADALTPWATFLRRSAAGARVQKCPVLRVFPNGSAGSKTTLRNPRPGLASSPVENQGTDSVIMRAPLPRRFRWESPAPPSA